MLTVAELIDALFRSHRKPDGREYTYREVSEALEGKLTPSHIGKLRSGVIEDPKRETLLALCQFFSVPPDYFFPELKGGVTSSVSSLPSHVRERLDDLARFLELSWPTTDQGPPADQQEPQDKS
jgi:transcriptional regulator with XRE-family HTH domain